MGACVHDRGGNAGPVNLPDWAVGTGNNHVVAKCAHVVEGDPGFVLPAGWHQCKRGDDTTRDLIDPRALCDENVARGEPGIDRLGWSDTYVFFSAVRNAGKGRQQGDVALAVDRIDIVAAVFGHNQIGARSGHAYRRIDSGKRSWISGVQDYCQRQQPYNRQSDLRSWGEGFHSGDSRFSLVRRFL